MNSQTGQGAPSPLRFEPVRAPRKSASQRLLDLFQEHAGEWIPLPRILALGIAQYNARIKELRLAGHRIENRTEREGMAKHSWFRYSKPNSGGVQ